MSAYSKERWRTAIAETRSQWAVHKVLGTILTPSIAAVLGFVISAVKAGGVHSWAQFGQAILTAITSALLVLIAGLSGALLINRARAPKLIYQKQQEMIQALSKPESETHKRRVQIVQTSIERSGESALVLLRHLSAVGKITLGRSTIPVDWETARTVLMALKEDGLVESQTISTGPRRIVRKDPIASAIFERLNDREVWTLVAEMKDAIEESI